MRTSLNVLNGMCVLECSKSSGICVIPAGGRALITKYLLSVNSSGKRRSCPQAMGASPTRLNREVLGSRHVRALHKSPRTAESPADFLIAFLCVSLLRFMGRLTFL